MADEKGQGGTSGLSIFKEVITAVIALVILAVTVWMLTCTFSSAQFKEPTARQDKGANPDPEAQQKQSEARAKERQDVFNEQEKAFTRRKDVMLYGLSLLGAIIGYYFGRVPAELHAQAAQRAAKDAQSQLSTTQDKLNDAAATASTAVQNAQQVTKQSEQLKAEVKQTLTAVKTNMAAPQDKPKTLGMAPGPPAATGLEQAERDIDVLLARL